MKKAILFMHGKGGNAAEGNRYKAICQGYDIYGLDYQGTTPWDAKDEIIDQYDALAEKYDSIVIIAYSIGAFFTMNALQGRNVEKALFVSPIVDMEKLINDMMMWANTNEAELEEKKEIPTDFGETLSWDYLCYARNNPIKWEVPTAVLYAGQDNLTSRQTVESFARNHNASLAVMENGEHWFHTDEQLEVLDNWVKKEIPKE